MLRCVTLSLAASLVALSAQAQAPAQRNFPAHALRGELVVVQPPEVLLNGRPARLAPGARIRGADNLIVPSAQLAGRKAVVHYTREMYGNLHEVWLLTPAELAKPWPKTADEAAKWRFDRLAQTWTK